MNKLASKLFFAVCAIAVSQSAVAQDLTKPFRDLMPGGQSSSGNEIAVLQGQNSTGDSSIKNCVYRTQRGFEFAVNIRTASCPRTVSINIQTMQVQIPNY